MKTTPDKIEALEPDEVFVFGSNDGGRHGAGAAKLALVRFGAKYGVGRGWQGQSYAIATLDRHFGKNSLADIHQQIQVLYTVALEHPEFRFLVTEIGCGLAGFPHKEIGPLFFWDGMHPPENVSLPASFWSYAEA